MFKIKTQTFVFQKKNLFIFHIWDRICRCRRQETFQYRNISSVKLKKNDLVDLKSLRIYWGLPPIRENNLSDTIWPFDGFLTLGLDKFTAWLYTAKSFSWAQPHKKGHWIFGLKCIPLPFLVLNNFHLCTKGRIPFNTLTKITSHAVFLELAVSSISHHFQT